MIDKDIETGYRAALAAFVAAVTLVLIFGIPLLLRP